MIQHRTIFPKVYIIDIRPGGTVASGVTSSTIISGELAGVNSSTFSSGGVAFTAAAAVSAE